MEYFSRCFLEVATVFMVWTNSNLLSSWKVLANSFRDKRWLDRQLQILKDHAGPDMLKEAVAGAPSSASSSAAGVAKGLESAAKILKNPEHFLMHQMLEVRFRGVIHF